MEPAPTTTPDPATYAQRSLGLLATILLLLSLPVIAGEPGTLIWLTLVIAALYPVFLSLYRSELERPSFELQTRPQAQARARGGEVARVGVAGPEEAAGAPTIRISIQAGQRCPYCHDQLVGTLAAEMLTCGACQTVLHRDCLKELGSCPTQGCRNRRAKRPA